ncbi:MAG TPA: alpha/beta fold hydrolase [Candidatus Pelethocola excrementipullorum]|nr:alpha/beta fold hydrolase [Candidatus Pelethocola excrementipullorum]
MDIELKRDGLYLRGRVEKGDEEKRMPAVIIFHGFAGNLGYEENDLYHRIARQIIANEMISVRFDFDGHGNSDGEFSDMDVLRELLDAITILKYVMERKDVSEVYILGHSQGGVIGTLLSGLYPDVIKKLILLAPAFTLKTDALLGTCMGTKYDTDHIPDSVLVDQRHNVGGHYFRIAKNLPIEELASKYTGETLIIHGRKDTYVDYHISEKYCKLMQKGKLILYDLLDHGIEGENQQEALDAIQHFLKR